MDTWPGLGIREGGTRLSHRLEGTVHKPCHLVSSGRSNGDGGIKSDVWP
jgi:hypothetical protein